MSRALFTVVLAFMLMPVALARAATPTITATIATPGPPGGLVATDAAMWSSGRGQISRIDVATDTLALALPFGTLPWLAVGEGSLWADGPQTAGVDATTVTRLDPVTGATQATIGVGAGPTGIGFTPGAVWVANHHGGTVSRIDPQTNAEVAVVPLEKPSIGGPQAVLGTPEGVWVGVPNMNAIVRIDPATNALVEVLRVNACVCTSHLVEDAEGGIWFGSDFHKNAVVHVWPHTHRVTWVPVNGPGKPEDPSFLDGFIWVPTDTGDLAQIDPATDRVVSTTTIGGTLHFSAVAFGSLWLGDDAGNQILRVTVR